MSVQAAESIKQTVIEPGGGWQAVNVRELWRFRELIYFLIWRDVKVRYKQTVLGAAWAVLQPALLMVVFVLFISREDPLYVYSGLVPWFFFASAMANAGNSVVGSERLITKIYFPRLAVPLAAVGAAVVDFLIASGLLVILMIWKGVLPGVGVLLTPAIVVLLALAAAGVGTILAALTVAYRDFRFIVPFLTQFWLFATPTIYAKPQENWSTIQKLLVDANPMCALIAAFRASTQNQPLPWHSLGVSAAVFIVLFMVGCLYFRRVEDTFADII